MKILILATVIAFFIKGLVGFANTLVFNSILSFSINIIDITPIEVILGYPSNAIIVWKKRKELNPKIWIPLSILVMVGTIPGVFLLKSGNVRLIKVLFGIMVLGIGIEMLTRQYQVKKKESSKKVLFIIGVISGIMCGLFGVGALLAAYIGRTTNNSDAFKGNLCIVFLIENTFRIAIYLLNGIITLPMLITVLKLMPFMLIGLFLGMKSSDLIAERFVKKMIIIFLIISGSALIIMNVL